MKNKPLKKLFNSTSFKARLARGSLWLSISGGADVSLKLVRNMVLARLIAPDAFGVMAIIIAVNSLFEAFTQIGIKEAIIQSADGQEKKYLNATWWISVARGIILYVTGYIASPLIADFYSMPELVSLLRVAFLSLIFASMTSSKAYVKLKEMDFFRWMFIPLTGSLSGVVTAISLSFIIEGTRALVLGFVVEAFSRFIVSYIISPFIPGFNFNKEYTRSIMKFAAGMFGLPMLAFIYMRADIFVLGKLCTQAELGIYSLAVTLARVPNIFMEKFVTPIFMPAFSEIQDNNQRINNGILTITFMLSIVGFPAIVFIFFNSNLILQLVYGEKYTPAAIAFSVLFMANVLRSISQPLVAVYFSKGKPQLHRLFTMVRAALLIIMLYPAIKMWGYSGAAYSVFLAMFISFFFQVNKLHSITNFKTTKYYSILLKCILYSVPLIIWQAISHLMFSNSIIEKSVINAIGVIIAYLFIIYKFVYPRIKEKK